GRYALNSLPGGDYTVTPDRNADTFTHYTYTPANRVFPNLNADQPAADFTGTRVFDIRGTVFSNLNGRGLFDVTITATGTSTITATSDADGNYRLEGLQRGGDYTITASKTDFTFTPPYFFPNMQSDLQGANFNTDSGTFFTISGRVADAG